MRTIPTTSYNNIFDLINGDLSKLEISTNSAKDNCLIKDKEKPGKFYNTFLLDENSQTKIVCEITFYPSSMTSRFVPRLTFKKLNKENETKELQSSKSIIIAFKESTQAAVFWRLIGFLNSFKNLVDLGEFEKSFQVVSKKKFFIEFNSQDEKQKIEDLKKLIKNTELKEDDIRSIVFENRKKTLKAFLFLLKDIKINGNQSIDEYRKKYNIQPGEEAIWHHFLKQHKWILGLSIDIRFIRDFFDEQKVGIEDSKGKGSPQTDLLGISNFTTLIELKHCGTNIFRKEKNKGRANTWDFSSDFIEGLSQCLGQRVALEKHYTEKQFISQNGIRLDKHKTLTIDPKIVFIIGNRSREFPHNLKDEHYIKSQTFEQIRRNNRNIDIITFDELFERAYHIVYDKNVPEDWHDNENFVI